MAEVFGSDAFSPKEIAERIGVTNQAISHTVKVAIRKLRWPEGNRP